MPRNKSRNTPPYRKIFEKNANKDNPEKAVESYLVNLEKLDKKNHAFWQDFYVYLTHEREKRLDDILEAIDSSKTRNVKIEKGSRIVTSSYTNDPLCTLGSVRKLSGGRFNFGNISSYHKSFHCLYLAKDFITAYAEVFHYLKDETVGEGELTPEEMQSLQPGSFSNNEIKGELDSVIDLTTDESMRAFLKIISEIKPSRSLQARANKLKLGKLKMTQSLNTLKKSFFDEKYTQWGIWINEPANSQWFGHYTKMAGVQAIIYPSCRAKNGINYAVFPDNFKNSDAYLSLVGDFPHIPQERQIINKDNYWTFKHTHSDLKQDNPH